MESVISFCFYKIFGKCDVYLKQNFLSKKINRTAFSKLIIKIYIIVRHWLKSESAKLTNEERLRSNNLTLLIYTIKINMIQANDKKKMFSEFLLIYNFVFFHFTLQVHKIYLWYNTMWMTMFYIVKMKHMSWILQIQNEKKVFYIKR